MTRSADSPLPATAPLPAPPRAAEPPRSKPTGNGVGPSNPYADGAEHLEHELSRVNALVQAYTLRWEDAVLGNQGSDGESIQKELRRFRSAPFRWADRPLDPDYQDALVDCHNNARRLEAEIVQRLGQTDAEVHLPLRHLQQKFHLAETQPGRPTRSDTLLQDVLLLALLAERSPTHRWLFSLMQEEGARRTGWPTVELALRILEPALSAEGYSWKVFAPDAPLLADGLVTVSESTPGEPLPRRVLRLDERLIDYLLGGDDLDPRLVDCVRWWQGRRDWSQLYLDSEELGRLQKLAVWWRQRRQEPPASLVLLLHSPYGTPRLEVAQAFCSSQDTPAGILIVNVPAALRRKDDWAALVVSCHREARLRGAALYWQAAEALLAHDQPPERWQTLVGRAERQGEVTFLASEVAWEPAEHFHQASRHFVRVDFQPPDRDIRHRIWTDRLVALGRETSGSATLELLANSFQFTEGQIDDALTTARGLDLYRGGPEPESWWEHLYEACRRQSARRLVTFAQRIEPRPGASLDNLVLPALNRRQMEELSQRIARRDYVYHVLGFEERLALGQGLVVLFTGASGTGKTMAAALLAGEQRVDLYKVDLAAIVSKYVGETEKNLGRLFTEAQDANAILFFDEADAIFGKRGEVADARDRWANLEVNYLLQRVEEYKGTVILATNLRQNIDEAFLRRIHVVVDFPFPDVEARLRIYKGCFTRVVAPPPPGELHELARRFPLSGGSIKNVVLDAAFRAAAAGGSAPAITLRHLVAAVAREYQKLCKPVTPGDFGPVYFEWVREDLLFATDPKRLRAHG